MENAATYMISLYIEEIIVNFISGKDFTMKINVKSPVNCIDNLSSASERLVNFSITSLSKSCHLFILQSYLFDGVMTSTRS